MPGDIAVSGIAHGLLLTDRLRTGGTLDRS